MSDQLPKRTYFSELNLENTKITFVVSKFNENINYLN